MKWNFKTSLENKPLSLVTGGNIVLRKIYVEIDGERKESFY